LQDGEDRPFGHDKNNRPPVQVLDRLVLAADQFIVDRFSTGDAPRTVENIPNGKTIIAGYHWFGDWGRDKMISLPGLTIATGRGDVEEEYLRNHPEEIDDYIYEKKPFPSKWVF
jgi:glycogen debranching enzyme